MTVQAGSRHLHPSVQAPPRTAHGLPPLDWIGRTGALSGVRIFPSVNMVNELWRCDVDGDKVIGIRQDEGHTMLLEAVRRKHPVDQVGYEANGKKEKRCPQSRRKSHGDGRSNRSRSPPGLIGEGSEGPSNPGRYRKPPKKNMCRTFANFDLLCRKDYDPGPVREGEGVGSFSSAPISSVTVSDAPAQKNVPSLIWGEEHGVLSPHPWPSITGR